MELVITNKIKQLLTESAIVAFGKFIGAIGSLFAVYVLTNNLSPEQYGILNLAMTFSIIVNQLLIGPLGAGSTRFFSASVEHNSSNVYLQIVFKFLQKINLIIVLFGIILIVIVGSIDISINWTYIILSVVLFTIISSYYSIYNGIFLALKKQLVTSIHQSLEPWTKAIFALICIMIFGDTGFIALIGYILGIIIVSLSQKIIFSKICFAREKKNNINWEKKILEYSFPFMLWGIFTAAHLISDRWVLQTFSTLSDVGMYSVLYQIGYFPIILIISILVQVVTPYLYQQAGNGDDNVRMSKVRTISKYLLIIPLVLTATMTLFVYLLSGFIFEYIISEEYSKVEYLLPYMTIAAGLFSTGQATTLILQSETKTSMLIKPKIVTAVIGIILNIIGGMLFGIEGIVYALIVYALIYLLWIQIIIFNYKKEKY